MVRIQISLSEMTITTTRMLQTSYSIQEGISKQEFVDGLCLRYRWSISHIPNLCVCSAKYCIDHVLTCKKGGCVHELWCSHRYRSKAGSVTEEVLQTIDFSISEYFKFKIVSTFSKYWMNEVVKKQYKSSIYARERETNRETLSLQEISWKQKIPWKNYVIESEIAKHWNWFLGNTSQVSQNVFWKNVTNI